MSSRLLPLNATVLERALADVMPSDLAVPIRDLMDPERCPVALLPYLAWSRSVDRWDDAWPEAVKRSVIRAAFYVHAHKGTLSALRRVIEPFGYVIEVVEWFDRVPMGIPGTFTLKVGVQDTGITEAVYAELTRLIDDARPVSRHLGALVISLDARGSEHLGAALMLGDELNIYPPAPADIDVGGVQAWGLREHLIDTLDIY